ncbi:MAG TPA: DLW-39 family protein [Micrococcaceae bacterium]|nr:DLW-39 family protein [Micrococcaceae bacterium]
MKKLLVAAAAVAGVLMYKKWQDSNIQKRTWSRATDSVK